MIALTTIDASDFLEAGETQGVRVKAGFESVDKETLFSTTAFARSLDGRFDVVGGLAYRNSGDITLGSGFTLPDDHEIVNAQQSAKQHRFGRSLRRQHPGRRIP